MCKIPIRFYFSNIRKCPIIRSALLGISRLIDTKSGAYGGVRLSIRLRRFRSFYQRLDAMRHIESKPGYHNERLHWNIDFLYCYENRFFTTFKQDNPLKKGGHK